MHTRPITSSIRSSTAPDVFLPPYPTPPQAKQLPYKLDAGPFAPQPDERTICSGSRDTSLRLWDVETGACTASVSVPRNLVTCLKYLPGPPASSSSTIAQGGEDLRLRVWDAREAGLRPALTVEGYTYFPVRACGDEKRCTISV